MTTTASIQTYKVDPSHSRAGFSVRHMGLSKVKGQFDNFSATVTMEPGNLESLAATAVIDPKSISTGEDKRDQHLRSADFFDTDSFDEIRFESTGVSDVKGDKFALHGNLTMHGVTKPITLNAELLGEGKDPWGNTRVAFEASQTINRKDFGLNWNTVLEAGGLLVSESVAIQLEIQAVME